MDSFAYEYLKADNSLSYIGELQTKMIAGVVKAIEDLIKSAIEQAGFDSNDLEFLKANVTRIITDGDPYEHYYFRYGMPEQKRIISISRDPVQDLSPIELARSVKMSVRYNYY